MATSLTRRPLPALVSLLALLVLAALVWWRVLHRSDAQTTTKPTCTPAPHAKLTLPAPGDITVSVLNATKRAGIAGRARTTLVTDGFNVPDQAGNDNPKKKIAGVAEIRFGPKGRPGAQLMHYYLPGARMVAVHSTKKTITVSLGQKYRKIVTPDAVKAALTKDDVALATTAPSPAGSASLSC